MTDSDTKQRLDTVLVARGLAASRARAQELIAGGKVRVAGAVCRKAATKIGAEESVELSEPDHPYVSRGALKLAGAVADCGVTLEGKTALDVGASTGGFTDFLLRNGVEHVYCVDVGTDQLHPSLRRDPRVTYRESTDIRGFSADVFTAKLDIITVDVSFISLTKVVPSLATLLGGGAELLALIKPQFEVGKAQLDKRGLVKDEAASEKACAAVRRCCEAHGFAVLKIVPSRVRGSEGNQEYFIYAKKI